MRIAYRRSKDYIPQREAVELNKEFLSGQFSFLEKIEFMIANHFSNELQPMHELKDHVQNSFEDSKEIININKLDKSDENKSKYNRKIYKSEPAHSFRLL